MRLLQQTSSNEYCRPGSVTWIHLKPLWNSLVKQCFLFNQRTLAPFCKILSNFSLRLPRVWSKCEARDWSSGIAHELWGLRPSTKFCWASSLCLVAAYWRSVWEGSRLFSRSRWYRPIGSATVQEHPCRSNHWKGQTDNLGRVPPPWSAEGCCREQATWISNDLVYPVWTTSWGTSFGSALCSGAHHLSGRLCGLAFSILSLSTHWYDPTMLICLVKPWHSNFWNDAVSHLFFKITIESEFDWLWVFEIP